MHTVFHVSLPKKYHKDPNDPNRRQSRMEGLNIQARGKRVAEAILDDRLVQRSRKVTQEYLIKWQGLSEEENTWELAKNLRPFQELIEEYEKWKAPRTSPESSGGECHAPSS